MFGWEPRQTFSYSLALVLEGKCFYLVLLAELWGSLFPWQKHLLPQSEKVLYGSCLTVWRTLHSVLYLVFFSFILLNSFTGGPLFHHYCTSKVVTLLMLLDITLCPTSHLNYYWVAYQLSLSCFSKYTIEKGMFFLTDLAQRSIWNLPSYSALITILLPFQTNSWRME